MPSLLRRAMVYLGLVDDEYDDYEPYDEMQSPAPAPMRRPGMQVADGTGEVAPVSSIRTLPRDPMGAMEPTGGAVTLQRPAVRPVSAVQSAKPHIVAPSGFHDAQEIGDRLKANQPVIVNLQGVDSELVRRLIDFCSGLSYAINPGGMDKVADRVFLLTPTNVEVSAEERRRLQERGLYRADR